MKLTGPASKWSNTTYPLHVLESVFPSTDKLIRGMSLEVTYKEATFETLNRPDFLESVKKAYPRVIWNKAYQEFRAAGEKKSRHA